MNFFHGAQNVFFFFMICFEGSQRRLDLKEDMNISISFRGFQDD